MLVESLIKETVELQGFRVVTVQKTGQGLEAELAPDRRYAPRCGACGEPARYRDARATRRFRHVPLWGIDVYLTYAPRRVVCERCGGVHVEAMPWVSGKRIRLKVGAESSPRVARAAVSEADAARVKTAYPCGRRGCNE